MDAPTPALVQSIVAETPVIDFHTHLFTPCHGPELCWWGIDDLLTYHYLIAETFRYLDMPYEKFRALSKKERAELVWKTLFVERTPLSEAARGVITCLTRLGADPNEKSIGKLRKFYSEFTPESIIDCVFKIANIKQVYMTNDPLDPLEREVWLKGHLEDTRFRKALRMDNFFRNWDYSLKTLKKDGLPVEKTLNKKSLKNLRKFFEKWCDRIAPEYLAASLAPDFRFPAPRDPHAKVIAEVVLPIARERSLPVALMIGVRRRANPDLGSAGDSIGFSDVQSVENLCRDNPDIRFFVTFLALENQHGLAVTARKFRNLVPFGCWWFLNNPSLIETITRMRFELLGLSFIPQHSDCRTIDQLLYKWDHSRVIIAKVLMEQYEKLASSGLTITLDQVRRDAETLLSGNVTRGLKG